VPLWSLLNADQEDDETNNSEQIARIAEPEAIFGHWANAFLASSVHPEIGKRPTELLADESANDHGNKLQTKLLRVEVELGTKELRSLDGDQHIAE